MTETERTLSVALHDLADHVPSGAAPVSSLLSRGRRRRHARTAFACAAGVTGAGVVAALATAGPRAVAPHDTALGAPGASPQGPIALSLAAERTDAGPFHFSLTAKTTESHGNGESGGQTRTSSSEGAYDPASSRGYTKAVGGLQSAETIRIGETCYAQPVAGGPWLALPCAASDDGFTLANLTQDPAAVLKQLEVDGEATYVGPAGGGSGEAADTWKFTVTEKPRVSSSGGSISVGYTVTGTATVGVSDGRVTAIDYTLTLDPNPVVADSVTDVAITFSDYGTPVNVSAPTTGSTAAGTR